MPKTEIEYAIAYNWFVYLPFNSTNTDKSQSYYAKKYFDLDDYKLLTREQISTIYNEEVVNKIYQIDYNTTRTNCIYCEKPHLDYVCDEQLKFLNSKI